jgi:PAS domain S-box-containing protein
LIGLEETTLQLLIEHTPAAVAIFDSNMRYLAASRRYIADYHLTGGALTGRSHYEVFPEISDRWRGIHRRCLNGAVERGKEELFLREDGTQDWVSWEIHPWRETSGAIGGIVLFSEVISAQKRLEQELAAQERDLEAVINNTDDSIWAVDAQYRLIAGNARYHGDVRAVLGRKLEKGESVLLPIFSPAALAEWQCYYDRALQGEQFSVEVRTRYAHPPCG